jgi:hypothetical protein
MGAVEKMEITKYLLEKINEIFRGVEYGRITFHISPENKTLNYSVETTHRIPIDRPELPLACKDTAKPRNKQ